MRCGRGSEATGATREDVATEALDPALAERVRYFPANWTASLAGHFPVRLPSSAKSTTLEDSPGSIVAVKPGHALTPAEIHAHCAANLARFKCPRLIEFVDALPRNATGKIHKPTLRQKFNAPKPTDKAAIAS